MTRRLLHGFCRVAIASTFLASGIEADRLVLANQQSPGRGQPPATVPDLLGRTEQEARELLAKARLRVGDITKVESKSKPGTVLKQDRMPGSPVAAGTPVGFALAIPITVVVPDRSANQPRPGRGQPPATVPDLSGRTEQDARELLAKARLRVGDITKIEANIKPGTVLKQDRTPGSPVAVGTPVGFALAIPIVPDRSANPGRGQPPATVPDLSGRTEQEARELLAKARLRVGEITQVEANIKPGTVLKQDRTPGSPAAVGTPVGFALAIPIVPDRSANPGRGQPPAKVPDLLGRTEQEARELLVKARLRAGDITKMEANIKPGTVLTQARTPGSPVAVGTPVGFALAIPITVVEPDRSANPGRGQPPATVPDLLGRTEQEARERLAKARLRVGDITTVEGNIKPGTVLTQDRMPGSPVAMGTPIGFALAIPITVVVPDPSANPGRGQQPTTVPDLSGRTEQEARELLAKVRLRVGDITTVEANNKPGTVLKQDHTPGSPVAVGTPIGFALAIPITVVVPDLSERTEQEARELLGKARLRVGDITTVEANIKPGIVLRQDRAPGSPVAVGTSVGFALAMPITVIVPDLSGRTEQEARELLGKARLRVGDITTVEANIKSGTVLKQDRAPSSPVAVGTPVGFALAIPITVVVPDLSERTEQEARELLAKARLRAGDITKIEANIKPGTVLRQDRAPGSPVAVGTSVGFALAIPITVIVPDLSGRTEQEARELLGKARLRVGDITTVEANSKPGTVLKQDRTPSSLVTVDTPVGFALAIPMTVAVPQLVGRTQAEAMTLLKNLELAIGDVSSEEARSPPGTVLSQQPDARTRVVIGTAVAIITARPVSILVPDVVSRSEADARQMLRNVELAAGTVSTEESRRPPGSVLRQSVATGTRLTIGTAVDLVTAIPVTVLIPGLVGQSEDRARQRLMDVELAAGTIQYQESAADSGTVLAQSINPDGRVPLGTLVNLVVAVAETVAVPSFVGLPVEQARRTILESRLQVGSEQRRGTKVEPPGTVVAQSNVPGTRVAVGTPIVLTVAMPMVVTVPRVVGLSRDAAAALITDVGLDVGNVAQRFSLRTGGTVLAQATAPGVQVQFGTPVAFDEALPRALWLAPASVLFLGSIAGLARARVRRRKLVNLQSDEAREKGPEPPPLNFAVCAHVDAGGDAHVQSDEKSAIRREVRIHPIADGGSQNLSGVAGDFVRGERREHDAPPPEEVPCRAHS